MQQANLDSEFARLRYNLSVGVLFHQGEAMGEASDQLIVEDILSFDVSDDELEAAACRDDPRIFTIAFCSQDWNYCYPG